MAPGEEIAFDPALAHVLAEDFHDAAVGGEMLVDRKNGGLPRFAGDFEDGIEAIGGGFIRTENAEIFRLEIALHYVAEVAAEHAGGFRCGPAGSLDVDGEAAEGRKMQGLQEQAAVGVRIHAHATHALWKYDEEKLKLEAEHGVDAGMARDLSRRLSGHRRRSRGPLSGWRRSHRLLQPRLMRGGCRSCSRGICDARGSNGRLGTKLLEIGKIARLFRARLNGGE
jgi:hypothetical protein